MVLYYGSTFDIFIYVIKYEMYYRNTVRFMLFDEIETLP